MERRAPFLKAPDAPLCRERAALQGFDVALEAARGEVLAVALEKDAGFVVALAVHEPPGVAGLSQGELFLEFFQRHFDEAGDFLAFALFEVHVSMARAAPPAPPAQELLEALFPFFSAVFSRFAWRHGLSLISRRVFQACAAKDSLRPYFSVGSVLPAAREPFILRAG